MNQLERHVIHSLRRGVGLPAVLNRAQNSKRMRIRRCFGQLLGSNYPRVLRLTLRFKEAP